MLKCFCVNSLKRLKAKTKTTHLVTVLLGTVQFLIGETIDVNVRPAEVAVTGPSNSTLPGCGYMHFIFGSAVYQWTLLSAPGDLTKILYSLVLFWMNFCHLTLNFALSVDDALSAGVAGVGLTVPTRSLRLAATSLVPNIARVTGTTSE